MADPNLTHDELWDDSALVASWNDTLDEYKKYHSLAQRGEKVHADSKPSGPSKTATAHLGTHGSSRTSSAPLNFVPPPTANTNTNTNTNTHMHSKPQHAPAPASVPELAMAATAAAPPALPGLSSLPQALVGGAQNEDVKNIMMSWYYAGYYTGLYEGQQKAWASMQESMHPQQEGA